MSTYEKGGLYRLKSRNLRFGVFDGDRGFIGIRTKFDTRYLFRESLADSGPFGTVFTAEPLGTTVPEGVEVREILRTEDRNTHRPVAVSEGGRGWYFTDTGETSPDIHPMGVPNDVLFTWLEEQERIHG